VYYPTTTTIDPNAAYGPLGIRYEVIIRYGNSQQVVVPLTTRP
jgi:hypothetical protein